jgi:uncharacterized protein (DUF952 family)
MAAIYKLLTTEEWAAFQSQGRLYGNALDEKDGFIHNSTAGQVPMTTEKYFTLRKDVVLVKVDPTRIVGEIKFELAKNGEYYPHIYNGFIPLEAVQNAEVLALDDQGKHLFPSFLN